MAAERPRIIYRLFRAGRVRAIIHIGIIKTGTTSIQSFLQANRSRLRGQGVLYPQYAIPGRSRSTSGTAMGTRDHNYLCERRLDSLYAPLRAECQAAGCPRLLLSAENLSQLYVSAEQIGALKAFLQRLGCDEIVIVLWLREIGSLFTSLCSQALQNGFMEYTHMLRPRCHPHYRLIMDYRALLQRWGAVFGREALQVRLFERGSFMQGDLLRDAVAAFGLEWDDRFTVPERKNESLNLLEMEVLRVANHLADGPTYYPGTAKHLLASAMRRHIAALDNPALCFVPPQAVVQAWREWAAEGNEWVRQEFFPGRSTLFEPPREQAENYELTHMTPDCWEALGRVLVRLCEENVRLQRQLRLRGGTVG